MNWERGFEWLGYGLMGAATAFIVIVGPIAVMGLLGMIVDREVVTFWGAVRAGSIPLAIVLALCALVVVAGAVL